MQKVIFHHPVHAIIVNDQDLHELLLIRERIDAMLAEADAIRYDSRAELPDDFLIPATPLDQFDF